MTHAKNKIEFHENKIIVDKKLATLESTLDETPFFNGSEFSMVDIAYAPLFFRFKCLSQLHNIHLLENYPKLSIWSKKIIEKQEVQASFPKKFDEYFEELLHLKKSFLSKNLLT